MMRNTLFTAVLLLLIFLFAAPSTADIQFAKIRSDNRDLILFSKFEYSHSGYVSVGVSSVRISPATANSSHEPDPSRTGFFLISQKLSNEYNLEVNPIVGDGFPGKKPDFRNPNLCTLDIKNITLLSTFQNLSDQSSFNRSYNVTNPGLYSLYFANCNNQSLVTMDVRTELYNADINDGGIISKDYLSADQPQPSLYLKFFLIYLCFLGFWSYLCFKNQQVCKKIHFLMHVLLCVTMFYFICAVGDQHNLKVTGTHYDHHGYWRVLFYLFKLMKDLLLYTVIAFLGVGWCFWKPVLQGGDLFYLTMVILLQVWANVCYIMVGESGPWVDSLINIDMIKVVEITCCLVVVMYSAVSTAEHFSSLKETSARPYYGFTSSNVFVFVVLVFLFFVPVIPFVAVAQEISSLVFYMVMFYIYRPSVLIEDEGEKSDALLV